MNKVYQGPWRNTGGQVLPIEAEALAVASMAHLLMRANGLYEIAGDLAFGSAIVEGLIVTLVAAESDEKPLIHCMTIADQKGVMISVMQERPDRHRVVLYRTDKWKRFGNAKPKLLKPPVRLRRLREGGSNV